MKWTAKAVNKLGRGTATATASATRRSYILRLSFGPGIQKHSRTFERAYLIDSPLLRPITETFSELEEELAGRVQSDRPEVAVCGNLKLAGSAYGKMSKLEDSC